MNVGIDGHTRIDNGNSAMLKSRLGCLRFRTLIGALLDEDFSELAALAKENYSTLAVMLPSNPSSCEDGSLDDLIQTMRFITIAQQEFRDTGEPFCGYAEMVDLIIHGAQSTADARTRQKYLSAAGSLMPALVAGREVPLYIEMLERLTLVLQKETWHHVALVSRPPQSLSILPRKYGELLKKSLDRFDTFTLDRGSKFNILLKRLMTAHALCDNAYAASNIPQCIEILADSNESGCSSPEGIKLAQQLLNFAESHAFALDWLTRAASEHRLPAAWLGMVAGIGNAGHFTKALERLRVGIAAGIVTPSLAIDYQRLELESMVREVSARSKADAFAAFQSEVRLKMQSNDVSEAIDACVFFRGARNNTNRFCFWADVEEQLDRIPQPQFGAGLRGVVFLASPSMPSAAMSLAPLLELKRRGYAVLPLWSETARGASTGNPELDAFAGSICSESQPTVIGHEIHSRAFLQPWKINWSRREILNSGVNVFQPVYEKMARIQQIFFIDPDENVGARSAFARCIAEIDRAVFVATRIGDWARTTSTPIRFVAAVSHYPPPAGFQRYCDSPSAVPDVEYVMVNAGYDTYFNNLETKTASTLTILNMTRNQNCRASFLGTRESFERWMADNEQHYEQYSRSVFDWLHIDRSKPAPRETAIDKEALLSRVEEARAAGKPVFVALGKIVYDLAVPHMGGPAHTDMSDWITHTVDTIGKSGGLLLVKPHPYENIVDISTRPNELFRDLIRCDLPGNVVFLPHGAFQNYELAKLVDVALIWNGTSIVEFGAQRVKVVSCDYWSAKDYHVNPFMPQDRSHYERLLADPNLIEFGEDNHRRSVFLLHFMSEAVRIPYPFATCGSTNLNLQQPPKLHVTEVDRLLKYGDAGIARCADAFEF